VLSAVPPGRLERVLGHLFDESKFMSSFGPRSLSKEHLDKPSVLEHEGRRFSIGYEPRESATRMKGGNSNWLGPVWIPIAYLLYRTLLRLDHGFGDTVMIPGDGRRADRTLREGATEIAERAIMIFERDKDGRRPAYGAREIFQHDPSFAGRVQ